MLLRVSVSLTSHGSLFPRWGDPDHPVYKRGRVSGAITFSGRQYGACTVNRWDSKNYKYPYIYIYNYLTIETHTKLVFLKRSSNITYKPFGIKASPAV